MKYLLSLLMLFVISCAKMEPGVDMRPTPFKMWACEFENDPGIDSVIFLDLRGGEYGQRAMFIEFIFESGDLVQVLPIDYEIHPTHVLHYGEALGGPPVRELEYSLTEETLVIVDAAEGMQSGLGDLRCMSNTEDL